MGATADKVHDRQNKSDRPITRTCVLDPLQSSKLFRFLSSSSPKRATGPTDEESGGQHDNIASPPTIHGDEDDADECHTSPDEPINRMRPGEAIQQGYQPASCNLEPGQADQSAMQSHEPKMHRLGPSHNSSHETSIKQKESESCTHHHEHHSHINYSSIPTMHQEQELSLTATDYKNAGNKLCLLNRYDEALQCYTRAIAKNPSVSIFYSNRALCHLKLQQWPEAVQDCRKALELDPELIKAHFFLGQTLAEMGLYDEALRHLQRAHELARDRQLNFGDDISYQIRLTKRRRWSKIENDETELEDELFSYLVSLIKRDTETKLGKFEQRSSAKSGECSSSQQIRETTLDDDEIASASAQTEICDIPKKIRSKCDIYSDKLERMFKNLKLQRSKREVPDYLCGKISFEIMRDPVITPSGITYDRHDIEEHLRRVGHFDPITRQPLTSNMLISNLAMKEVVDAYLSENEWANYY